MGESPLSPGAYGLDMEKSGQGSADVTRSAEVSIVVVVPLMVVGREVKQMAPLCNRKSSCQVGVVRVMA